MTQTAKRLNECRGLQCNESKLYIGNKYEGYEEALKYMKLDSLKQRREKMALKFEKKSLKQENFSKLFPLNTSKHVMEKRSPEKYAVNYTDYVESHVPFPEKLIFVGIRKRKGLIKRSN